MAPLSRNDDQQVSPNSRSDDRWTIVTNCPKGSRASCESSAIADKAGDLSISPQAEIATLQPQRTKLLPPAARARSFEPTSQTPASETISNQSQTQVKPPTQRCGQSNRELIGHPDVLDKDYRKKRKRDFEASDEEGTSSSESESELECLDSESDSTLYSESDTGGNSDSDEETVTEEPTPDHNEYASLRQDLVEFISNHFANWMTSVRYMMPPDHRLKRTRRSRHGAKRTNIFIEEADPKDPDAVFISSIDGYYHLACPFYRYNPSRYQNCTARHTLKSIEDLVEHIVHHHAEPPLCKICYKVFDSFKARNDHLRNETCEAKEKDSQTPLGVTQLQRVKILKKDNPRRTEEDRWARIYKTIFDAEPSISAYLMEGEGYRFPLLHDYWKAQGKECVRKYLTDHGHRQEGAGGLRDFSRLCSMVLEDLRRKVAEEGQGQSEKEGE